MQPTDDASSRPSLARANGHDVVDPVRARAQGMGLSAPLTMYLSWHVEEGQLARAALHRLIAGPSLQPGLTQALGVLRLEFEADDAVLRECVRRLGPIGPAGRPDAPHSASGHDPGPTRTSADTFLWFIELEHLTQKLLARRSLWRALSLLPAAIHGRQAPDFGTLEGRALDQFARVEALRLRLAEAALAPDTTLDSRQQ